ncbi:uncharacterized protein LOC124815590 [Hydra vulgaris]|uniref:uncharacterized protein LOC124815590 n=1 Tax=Hydra vulgaris TaxID=6087 RepID=UPI0032EA5A7C
MDRGSLGNFRTKIVKYSSNEDRRSNTLHWKKEVEDGVPKKKRRVVDMKTSKQHRFLRKKPQKKVCKDINRVVLANYIPGR